MRLTFRSDLVKTRVEFYPRPDATPLQQLVDGFIFLSGGIFQFVEGVAQRAEEWGFAGKIRLDVVTKDLLDEAVEPLAEQYSEAELERSMEILRGAIERIGRRFYSHEYDDDELDEPEDYDWAETA